MQTAYEERYHQLEARQWWFVARRHILRNLVQRESPDRRSRILDLGCSGGELLKELLDDGYPSASGIDLSFEAVALCRAAGLRVDRMDAQLLDFPNATFDVLIASDVLEHIQDDQQALQEWGRVLKPGGLLMVFVPAYMFLWTEHDEANMHYRRYRRMELARLLRANGFLVERSSYWNTLLFPPVAVIRLWRRWCSGKSDSGDKGDLIEPAPRVNALLTALLHAENHLLCFGLNWPVGVSVMALARKPLYPKH